MKNEAAFGHEECGKEGKRICALRFIFHSGAAAASCSRSECFIERCELMRNDKLSVQSMDFAVDIIALVKELKNQRETIMSNQIGRSGTSIGANIREAQYAHGKSDFIAKLQIALKEANETGYWLELLQRTGYLPMETYRKLDAQCTSLRAMLIASINTAKSNAT